MGTCEGIMEGTLEALIRKRRIKEKVCTGLRSKTNYCLIIYPNF